MLQHYISVYLIIYNSIDGTVAGMRAPEFDRSQKNDQYQKVMGALDKAETEPDN